MMNFYGSLSSSSCSFNFLWNSIITIKKDMFSTAIQTDRKKISQNESKQTINHSARMKTFTLGNHVVYIFPTPRRRNANIYFDESALFFSLSVWLFDRRSNYDCDIWAFVIDSIIMHLKNDSFLSSHFGLSDIRKQWQMNWDFRDDCIN